MTGSDFIFDLVKLTLESRIIGVVGIIGGLNIVEIINNRGGWNKNVLGGKIEKLTIVGGGTIIWE